MKGRGLIPVFAANVLFGAGLFAHAFLYNFYLRAAGHGPAVMGYAAAALTAGGLAALVPAGWLVDRRGPVAGYGVAAVLGAVGLMLGALVTTPAAIYGAAVIAGAGTAIWRVSMSPLLLRLTEGGLRARALSWNVALLVATGALWTTLSGRSTDWLQALGWSGDEAIRGVLLIGACATALAGPAVLFIGTRSGTEPRERIGSGFALPAGILAAVVLVAIWMTAGGLVIPFFNVFFSSEHGLSVPRTADVLAASQAVTALALAASAEVAARFGPRRALVIWLALFPPVLWALAVTGSLPLAIGLFLVQGIVPAATNPLIDQLLLERVTPDRHGAVSSARNAATEASGLAGASLGGKVLEAFSFGGLFVLAGCVAAVGAVGLGGWLARSQRSDPSDTLPRSKRQTRSA